MYTFMLNIRFWFMVEKYIDAHQARLRALSERHLHYEHVLQHIKSDVGHRKFSVRTTHWNTLLDTLQHCCLLADDLVQEHVSNNERTPNFYVELLGKDVDRARCAAEFRARFEANDLSALQAFRHSVAHPSGKKAQEGAVRIKDRSLERKSGIVGRVLRNCKLVLHEHMLLSTCVSSTWVVEGTVQEFVGLEDRAIIDDARAHADLILYGRSLDRGLRERFIATSYGLNDGHAAMVKRTRVKESTLKVVK